jgi:KDO2-lipid IV(A) lauroyltransferase
MPCTVYHDRKGHYQAIFGPPIRAERQGTLREDVARITAELVATFEEYIRKAPEQWHVFQPIWPISTDVGAVAEVAQTR